MIKIRNYINVKLNDVEFKAKYNPEKIRFEYKLSENLLFVLECLDGNLVGKPIRCIENGDLIYRIFYKKHQIYSCPVYPHLFDRLACVDKLFERESYSFEFTEIHKNYVQDCDIENLLQELRKVFPKFENIYHDINSFNLSFNGTLNNKIDNTTNDAMEEFYLIKAENRMLKNEIKNLSKKIDDITEFLKTEKEKREKEERSRIPYYDAHFID